MLTKKKIIQLLMIFVPLIGFAVLGFMTSWQFTLVFIGVVVFIIGFASWVNDKLY